MTKTRALLLAACLLGLTPNALAGGRGADDPDALPTLGDGGCLLDQDCGRHAVCALDAAEVMGADAEAEGQCVIDAASLPVDPQCRTTCQLALPCAWSSWPGERPFPAPSSLAEADVRVADCAGLCSYALANGVGTAEVLDAVTCVSAQGTCDALQAYCVAAIEGFAGTIQSLPVAVPASWEPEPHTLLAGPPVEQDGPPPGPTIEPLDEDLPTEPCDEAPLALAGAASGCGGAPTGALPASLAFALLGAAALGRRRQRTAR